MAPEIMTQKYADTSNPYTRRSDVYAFGVVVFEIFTRTLPFIHESTMNKDMLLWQIGSGRLKLSERMLHEKRAPSAVIELILECVKYSPDDRLTFKEIVSKLDSIKTTLPKLKRCLSL
jgi:serine/threonine protein kinase